MGLVAETSPYCVPVQVFKLISFFLFKCAICLVDLENKTIKRMNCFCYRVYSSKGQAATSRLSVTELSSPHPRGSEGRKILVTCLIDIFSTMRGVPAFPDIVAAGICHSQNEACLK